MGAESNCVILQVNYLQKFAGSYKDFDCFPDTV